MDMQHLQAGSSGAFSAVSLAIIFGLLAAYLSAWCIQRRKGHGWSLWRSAAFIAGAGVLAVAVSPPLVDFAHHDLRGHMVQHLLIGMFAPLGLVLGAPMLLILRTLSPPVARAVIRVLRSRPLQVLSHPVTALMLNVGGMYVLYMTPLYAATLTSPLLHHLVHCHFLAAGYLFTWAILAGPDPVPHPPTMWLRIGVLFASIAAHAALGKLMYGYLWPRGTNHNVEEIRAAAELMYYGGDLAEVLLVVVLFALWYRRRGARPYSLRPLLM